MADLVVVVPGITGSVLRSQDREIWNLSVAAAINGLRHSAEVLAAMRLPEGIGDDAPDDAGSRLVPTGLISGIHLWPGFWNGSGYGRLLQALNRRGDERIVPFAYDWRLSNRLNARRLQAVVERELGRWREQSGNEHAEVIFVCHSMGGLVARYYLGCLGGAAIARRLITIGTPYSGSLKALKALTGGLVPRFGRLDRSLVDVARTFPSVHQLLPTYHCIDVAGSSPLTLADRDIPDLPRAAVANGMAFHQEFSAADAEPPSYETYFFGGKNQPTDQSVALTADGIVYRRAQRGTDYKGDGTVPFFSSTPPSAGTTAAGHYFSTRHARLQSATSVLDAVGDKVDAVDYGEMLAPPIELALDIPDVVVAGERFAIEVSAEATNLFLHASVTADDGRVHDEHIPVEPDGEGRYTTDLQLPAGTWEIEVQTVDDPLPARIGDVVVAAT